MQDYAELGRSMLAFLKHMANEENADKQGCVLIDIEELEEIGKIAEAQFDRFDKLYQVTNDRITNLDIAFNETNSKIASLNVTSLLVKHDISWHKLDRELHQMRVKLGELEARIERQED